MGLGVIVIANDFTALNVALPAIEEDFNVDLGTAQWVDQRLLPGLRHGDRHRRPARRHVRAPPAPSSSAARSSPGFSLLGGAGPERRWLIACRVGMGIGGALMWPAILGMTYAALPESKAGLAGGLILGAAGFGNAIGPAARRRAHRRAELALDLLPQRPDRRLRRPRHLAQGPPAAPGGGGERIDYPGIVTLSAGLLLVLLAFDQAADWGFGDPRVIAMLAVGGPARRRVRPDRAADEGRRPGARRRVPQRRVPLRLPDRAADVGGLLRHRALRAAVHGEDPRLLGARGRARDGADARHVRPRLVLRRARRTSASAPSRRSRSAPLGLAIGPFLLSLLDADSGYGALVPGLAVTGIGAGLLLLGDHDRGRHRARSLARQPRRRADLHVPDRGRRDRARRSRPRSSRSPPRTSSPTRRPPPAPS